MGQSPHTSPHPFAPLTPLSHTKAKSPRPEGAGERGDETERIQATERETDRRREMVKERWRVKSNGTRTVDGGGVESERVRGGVE